MRQFAVFSILLLIRRSEADPMERPPSIYEWIEENAHICTSIPSEGENVVNFLTPAEGSKCSLCPEAPPNKAPTSACAVELSPNEVDVEIGCHPVPELCLLELKSRYEEFFGGSKASNNNPTLSTSPQEEDIFMAKSNPFDGNIVSSLGRSSNNGPERLNQIPSLTSSIPQSTIFVPFTQPPTTSTTTTQLPRIETTTRIFLTTTERREVQRPPPTVSSPLHHRPIHQQTNSFRENRFEPTISTTTQQPETPDDLIQVDADSGDSKIDSTTVRASVFSSSAGEPIHIEGRLNEIATHSRVSIPISTTSTRSPLIQSTRLQLNQEVMPIDMPKINPSKSLFEKRTESIQAPRFQPETTTRSFNNNSWALLRTDSPQQTTPLPLIRTTRHSLETGQFNRSTKLLSNGEVECRDKHLLCCFWAISGECDSNPFWMRIHCSKTSDQCVSIGINCTIPTTTTTPLPTTKPSTTTPLPTTTSTIQTSTSRLTPPPKFNRFTIRPRKLPTWKTRPLDSSNPAGPPAFRPKNDEDGSSLSNKVESVTKSAVISGEYADSDSVKVSSSSNEFVKRPGIKGPVSTSSTENSLDSSESTEIPSTVTTSTSTRLTTTTPANCFNYNRLCQFWADLGECVRNPFWMRPHCQLACQSCGETLHDVFAPKPKPDCVNQAILCPFWAFIGECARNPRWMLKNCAPSCQVC